MSENRPPKRTIVSQAAVVRAASRVPTVNKMLEDALNIVDEQLGRFRVKSGGNQQLDEKEARILQGYVKSLIEISREEREREKSDKGLKDLENLSNEELIELAKAALSKK